MVTKDVESLSESVAKVADLVVVELTSEMTRIGDDDDGDDEEEEDGVMDQVRSRKSYCSNFINL